MFSTCPETNFSFSVTIILSSANTFDLNQSRKLSFGKELSDMLDEMNNRDALSPLLPELGSNIYRPQSCNFFNGEIVFDTGK